MGVDTLTKQIIEFLSGGWYSNYQINMYFKSSSADRIMRFIRKSPPQGMKVIQRKKELPENGKYRKCLEYTLVTEETC